MVFWGLYRGPPVLGNYHISRKHTKLTPGSIPPSKSARPVLAVQGIVVKERGPCNMKARSSATVDFDEEP